jgi:hypothetical protein
MLFRVSLARAILVLFILFSFSACGDGASNNSNNPIAVQDRVVDKNNTISPTVEIKRKKLAYLASSDSSYSNLGLKKDRVEIWENGMRTDGGEGSYEWWYCDYIFSDGTVVNVAFYTKLLFDTYGAETPLATINIIYPYGRVVNDKIVLYGQKIDASTNYADVHIGKSYLTYTNGNYKLHYEHNGIVFDAQMNSTTPMWRPNTGHIYFGESEEKYFAWLPAQPSSDVTATLEYKGNKKSLLGEGYHDHNWGNSPIDKNINNWYWGRATVGEYRVIFSDIIAEEKYNNERIPIMMISKNGNILDLNSTIEVEHKDVVTDKQTKKLYANKLYFSQKDKEGRIYTIRSIRKNDMAFIDIDKLTHSLIFMGNYPTYLRSLSEVELVVRELDGSEKSYKGVGIIEQVSFNYEVVDTLKGS